MNNRRTVINLISSLAVLFIGVAISFFLSPFIVKNIGVEANGFVTLANNFVGYANIIVIALNGMAARYISIAYNKKDIDKANIYYNSVFWGNIILLLILTLPVAIFLIFLDVFINIPSTIVLDVKLLFLFIFAGFYLQTGFPNYDCGTYITNRLDRTYVPRMVVAFIRCIFLFVVFSFFSPQIWFVGIASTLVASLLLIVEGYNTHKLTPELKICFKKPIVSFSAIKKLVSAGVWNAISNVGKMLFSSFDLIICNLVLGPKQMGVLALSKIILSLIDELANSICRVFLPQLTIDYSKDDNEGIKSNIIKSMKIMTIILTIPIAAIIVFGDSFFSLWVPSQDANILKWISILAISSYIFCSGTSSLINVFTVVNKVKTNSIAIILSGFLSIITTIVLVNTTNLGIFAVAGVSSFYIIIKDIFFTVPYVSKIVDINKKLMYRQMIISVLVSIILVVIGEFYSLIININNWFGFIISMSGYGIITLIINSFMILNKDEKDKIISKVRSLVRR